MQLYWKETPTQVFSCKYCKTFMNSFFHRTPLVAASEKYEYRTHMLDLLKDCYKCFLLSLIKIHLNEPIICYNFSFLIEKSFWNLSSLLHNLTYRFWICLSWARFLSSPMTIFSEVSPKQIFSVNKLYYVILQSFFLYPAVSHIFMVQVFQGASSGSGASF